MYNALVGAKIEEDNTDYYYLTRLLNFRNEYSLGKIKDEEFTDKLLDVLKRNPRFEKLSRLCISVAYPLSHKIGVLSD
ncbi:hypothetical protein M901_2484 [Bacteriovorax sp. DB6_IX]|nr:hypothetical protein M901_2484 [Bacteriovorax sp. DB6_IX]